MVYINDQFKFIFIENPKCASTAIICAFNKMFNISINRQIPPICHLTVDQIKKKYPNEWNEYFKVTTQRDPFERFCSSINFSHHKEKYCYNLTVLEEHLKNPRCIYCIPQIEYTKECDYIIRTSHFQEDFDLFCKKLSLISIKLITINVSQDDDSIDKITLKKLFDKYYKN